HDFFRQDRQDLQDLPQKSYPVDPVNPVKGHDLLDINTQVNYYSTRQIEMVTHIDKLEIPRKIIINCGIMPAKPGR
ncbi:MAG: hypothetical protein O8C61_09370, partial [Candidatus Methanoperedens sp.]|nr:hypothetical protein [Candidatus Methanoperedens sp.]